MQITPIQAVLVAVAAYLGISTWFFGVGFFTVYRPLIGGTIVGLILGDINKGMQLGAAINAIYLGFISTGGTLPGDLIAAGYMGTALALAAGLDAPTTLALLAVPLGLLGGGLWFLRMTLGSFLTHWADQAAKKGDTRRVAWINLWGGQILLFILYALPTFFVVLYGQEMIAAVNELIPGDLVISLAMVGGILPSVGIGMLLSYMGRRKLVPFFVAGFLLATYLELPVLVIGLLALVAVWWHTETQERPTTAAESQLGSEMATPESPLSRRDVLGSWFRWLTFSHSCYNFERLQGLGFAHAMAPVIRRLYGDARDRAAALKRHLVFFNTEPNAGAMVPSIVIAMEEQRASGADVSDEAINSIKAGLMGPLAGVGDSITQGLITPILLALGISLAAEGSLAGPVLYFVLESVAIVGISYLSWSWGYRWGRQAVARVLASGRLKTLTDGAAAVGMAVAGALVASVVAFSLSAAITVGQQKVALQTDVLDHILKGLLPLLLTLFVWWLLERRVSPLAVIAGLFVFGIVATYVGLLGWGETRLQPANLLRWPPLVAIGLGIVGWLWVRVRRQSDSAKG